MRISKESWIIKWAWLLEPEKIPAKTNICELFKKAFLVMPMFCVLCVIFSPLLLTVWLGEEWEKRHPKKHKIKRPNIIKQRFKDWKDKTCSIVEIA